MKFKSRHEETVYRLLKSLYPDISILQEYSYKKHLVSYYKRSKVLKENQDGYLLSKSYNLHADFFLNNFSLFIEVDGEHHDKIVVWAGKDVVKAQTALVNQKTNDRVKDSIAKETNSTILRIKTNLCDKLDADLLLNMLCKVI